MKPMMISYPKRTRHLLVAVLAVLVLAISTVGVGTNSARAADPAYDRDMILSNAVFDATNTMSAAQIQTFLDKYPNSCLKDLTAPVPKGYRTYGPDGRAADVIRAAATLWGVNPQVLLVTLQKEQSLVNGNGGCDQWRYWSAMGYNCPDGGGRYNYPNLGITGTCVKREIDAGFAAQVNHGAWQLQFNRQRAEGNLDWNGSSSIHNYGFNTAGYRRASAGAPSIYYDGWATIDGQPVFMTNGATATLYTYTPHLSANKVFYNLFTDWFGSVGNPPATPPPTTPPPSTAPPTTTPPATGPTVDYIDSVHRVFMGRRSTAGERHLWATYLSNGGSRSFFVRHVIASPEYSQNLVNDAYRKVLLRVADAGGLQTWTDVLVRSGRDDTMFAGLAGSGEYFQNRAKDDDLLFLSAVYQDFLDRNIDPTGLATWREHLSDGTMTRGQVAFAVLQSREYAGRIVGASYARVLGRWPDPAGNRHWIDIYLRHHRAGDIGSGLASSPEGFAYLSSLR